MIVRACSLLELYTPCTHTHNPAHFGTMPKSLVLRSKEEAMESPAVWLCVYNAIAHAKKLAAGRRHHAAHRKENNETASKRKKQKWKNNTEEARREQQEYRERKASANYEPKKRKRGIDVEGQKATAKKWRAENTERSAQISHDSYVRHKDEIIARTAARNKAARGTGSRHAIMMLCRDRINDALKAGGKNGKHTSELLGCSYDEYIAHLGPLHKRMKELNLVIDHIWPIALYDISNAEEQKKAFNYRNTRLCTADENRRKGKKPPDEALAHTVPQELWPAI